MTLRTGIQNGWIATFCFWSSREFRKEGYWWTFSLFTKIPCFRASGSPRTPTCDRRWIYNVKQINSPCKQIRSNFTGIFRPTWDCKPIFERWFLYVLFALFNTVIMDSRENDSKYDFSKKEPLKLESTCKIAWPFVIWEIFCVFSKVFGIAWKVYGVRARVSMKGFGDWKPFDLPVQKVP